MRAPTGPRDRTATGRTATRLTSSRFTASGLTSRGRRTVGPQRWRWYRRLRRLGRRLVAHLRVSAAAAGGVITRLGWAVLATAAGSLSVGYALGWREFAAAGVGLGLLAVVSALFLIGRTRFSVTLVVPTVRTVVGSAVTGSVELGSESRRPLWGARLEVLVGDELVPLELPARNHPGRVGGHSENLFAVPAVRRGIVTVGPVRTVRGDPLGLFRRDVSWTDTVDVFVHPATVAVPSTSTGFVRDLEGSPTRDLTANDISFHALRDYRPGDDRRHIHWKSTARTGQLTVRQFEETRRSHVVVAFSLAEADYASVDEFEMSVGAASSIALRAIRDGRDITVLTSPGDHDTATEESLGSRRAPRVISARGRQALLDDMSGLREGSSEVGLGALAGLANEYVSGVSLVFLVVGSPPSVRELQSWSLRFPLGVEIVAIVCTPQDRPGLRRVAELSVITLGYLDDLRASLALGATA